MRRFMLLLVFGGLFVGAPSLWVWVFATIVLVGLVSVIARNSKAVDKPPDDRPGSAEVKREAESPPAVLPEALRDTAWEDWRLLKAARSQWIN